MKLQLLEIGSETEQLSACRLSLLLGVFTATNQIERFLSSARKILGVERSALAFEGEPYLWYAHQDCFKAFIAPDHIQIVELFDGQDCIHTEHPHYIQLVERIGSLGVEAKRFMAFDLKMSDGRSIGQILFFDQNEQPFSLQAIEILSDLATNLVNYLELKADHAELKEMYEQQAALNFSKTKFFQIIAHDLRAPFHGLLGFSEVLAQERETLDDSSVQNIADYLYDTAQSTYNLLESLLNWAMAEGGRFIYHPINFKLQQSSKIVCDVLNSLAVKKNIQLINQIDDDIKVYADINMITSVIQNLVSNALKFTPTDGTGKVTLRAEQADDGVHIYIQDTGLGMSQSQMEQLFQAAVTASSKGTAGEKGTGLGLVLCKRFVDLNKGEIVVESNEGEGTTFIVTLPQATSAHQALMPEDIQFEKVKM
ncbi:MULTISPECIES: GAF domain-containing sensor histidine kinase [Acinetobacter]|uniref:GAF domain-containing sensor histidine kinase n=1 Tax=Acinetobacter TaxID=469 RepID=UPI001443CCD0|nr:MULTISPECIES: GAF domain-containing sensor histidine kinase [Acinetobacter]MCP0915555.1 GAF domain-containing sensor histidine kinase [Acinetobacter indicus]MCP0918681.1 GAF domain-containing sensor histidine kinase [Acinetobacter indicus]MCP0921347.1 GAF domain-containing sensor histidine kinase [Acinetobacter indicus]MDM1261418.1 HAMP domain-containing histidine kinase [Acinetobacter indicus]